MKTLLLSSSGSTIFKFLPSIINKPITQLKLAWITTASKGVDDVSYLERHKQKMIELGWNFTEVDIEGKTVETLRNLLKDKDIIHVEGGNTFYLLKAVKESGFDKVIKERIAGGVVYVGSSAGSYIMCPTIEMSTWKPDAKPRYGLTDLTGLNQVPFLLFVHYDPKYKKLLKQAIKKTKYPVKILTDDQALLVKNGKAELIGEGSEIKLAA
ncbi:MAG: hypothetical protein A2951_02075 [Candidatus Buchananbacteria bacterium RIFCSPLOWO2_01_FULL_56_15]|uniref:Peptidase E n=2 Tax=Candidatus Buchananiibacteriota TaxID=1817903 RepID=A0A1G1YDY5_9BACT|nr:MAG: hypothetical protein A3J59_05050 [Candidatus Buchananbacteria bacterium RIFCSPHIGHO2_02_FULL_56_16]OGY55201.1 MAG: hypothetical protein A2951_02075 [Candidatus Buchananbacteria bacterium RIFCSPLOWO2_01_FULL_56_15]